MRHRRPGEASHLLEMIAVLLNKALASGRRRPGENVALVEIERQRADDGGEVHVVLRISRGEGKQPGPGEVLQSASAASAQSRVDAREGPDAKKNRSPGVSAFVQPDDEALDERTQERQRREVRVTAWTDICKHDGLLEGAVTLQAPVMWSSATRRTSATDEGDARDST